MRRSRRSENTARYGREKRRCRVTRAAGRGVPSSSVRPVTTATGTTDGAGLRSSRRSSRYSWNASSSVVSFTATMPPPIRAKRTT